MSKNYKCPYCKQEIGLLEYYAKGHVNRRCPLNDKQMEQLDRISKVAEDE